MRGLLRFDHGVPESHMLAFIFAEGLASGLGLRQGGGTGIASAEGGFTLEGVAAMKRLVIVVCLAGAVPGSKAVAADWFPWFHTRPKPVLLDDQPSRLAAQSTGATHNRVPYHGTAVYPGSGRLYFKDAYDSQVHHAAPSKSRFSDLLIRGWRSDSQPASSAKSK
jgi:hypothetical protein